MAQTAPGQKRRLIEFPSPWKGAAREWIWAGIAAASWVTAPAADRLDRFLYVALHVATCVFLAWLIMRWSPRTRPHQLWATLVLAIALGLGNIALREADAEIQPPKPGEPFTLREREAAARLTRHFLRAAWPVVYCMDREPSFGADTARIGHVLSQWAVRNGAIQEQATAILKSSGALTYEGKRRMDREATAWVKANFPSENRVALCRKHLDRIRAGAFDVSRDPKLATDASLIASGGKGARPARD